MMKKLFFLLLLCCQWDTHGADYRNLSQWRFHLGALPPAAFTTSYDDSSWQQVRVPHDWAIDRPFDMRIDMQSVQVLEDGDKAPAIRTGRTGALPAFGVGCYRTVIPHDPLLKGKRIRVEFDGAMSLAQICLNGRLVGEHPYGYTSFAVDLTQYWNFDGENLLAVRLENRPESSRWYPGAGLYRHVRLAVSDPVSVAHWGVFVTTPVVSAAKGVAHITTEVENHSQARNLRLESQIIDPEGRVVGQTSSQLAATGRPVKFDQKITVRKPRLWSTDTPLLYTLRTRVYADNRLTDTHTTPFGFRELKFDSHRGLSLNGRPVKLQGVCLHHDLGPLGAAVNYRATQRQIEMMQEMGCNSIRTSHNPPSPELLELCDKMGMLVIVEAFDEWKTGKNANGYHLYFDEWAERDIRAMVRRDRNHPSVIMWSLGNEVREQRRKDGAEIIGRLAAWCKAEDPTRPTTAGFNNHTSAIDMGLADKIDVVGFNYKPWDYADKHSAYPDMVIYGSETASTVSSRGEYKFPVREFRNVYYDDYQVSSYDMEYPNWASTPDTEFEQQDDCRFVLGEYVWTGFDYLGEPTPYNAGTPARSSYFGIVDLGGIPKDRYYLYQSKWSKRPVLHLLPHWNWEGHEGDTIPVYCYTNYPRAELFVNGKSMGVKEKRTDGTKYERYRMMWDNVVYAPGQIKVVGYDRAGNACAEKCINTASRSYKVRTTADRREIRADGTDLSYITVEVVDREGNLCPTADHLLFFDVEGAGRLKAVCNGDATDQTPFSSSYMKTFNGKLMLIVEAGDTPGEIRVNIYGGHLLPAVEKISVAE